MTTKDVALLPLVGLALIASVLTGCGPPPVKKADHGLSVDAPKTVGVFQKWEANLSFSEELVALSELGGIQANDAYDADRDGRYLRTSATFTHSSGQTMRVPGFAMKDIASGPWVHRLRWSPPRTGEWSVQVDVDGDAGAGPVHTRSAIMTVQAMEVDASGGGMLTAPVPGQNPAYLRERQPDGSSRAIWTFGTCRPWSVRHSDPNGVWKEDELIDRGTELLEPMRRNGLNMLNQWMAPWEYLLVHHASVEHWENANGHFDGVPVKPEEEWRSDMYIDQGRARAFDSLVAACEGVPPQAVVRLLLAPLPHPLFRSKTHPWHEGASFWSPWENPELPKSSMNGFCTDESMTPWDFFKANARSPLDDSRSQLFDAQANFFRYLIARWGYSPAIGGWVLLDEIEGIGDDEAYLRVRSGYWNHPECTRWLNDTVRLFRGRLRRVEDGNHYDGDPYRHVISAGSSSVKGDYGRGANLDWAWGDPDARPDLSGWHFYPPLPGSNGQWSHLWESVIAGTTTYSTAPLGRHPRLITEFGAPERRAPYDKMSGLYPSILHFGAWSAIMSGHAGTVMDWNDGKSFGEFHWKEKGAFSKNRYPYSQGEIITRIRTFLEGLDPEGARVVGRPGSNLAFAVDDTVVALGLHDETGVWAWCYVPEAVGDRTMTVKGLGAGTYTVSLVDPWTGRTVGAQKVAVQGKLTLDLSPGLGDLATDAAFPERTVHWTGRDMAFRILKTAK